MNRSGTSPIEDFLELSRVLTGVKALDPELGKQYFERLIGTPFGPVLQQILQQFSAPTKSEDSEQVTHKILADDKFRPTICQIILLWYTSAMQDNPSDPKTVTNMRFGTQEEYFSGLGWGIIGAHVPGLSGGYFGHWRYRPDNEPSESADEK